MALSDILLTSGDQYMELEFLDGSLYSPKDITSDANGIYELLYIPSVEGIDILTSSFNSGMVSEISHDPIQIFVNIDGRIAIRLDNQIIHILD